MCVFFCFEMEVKNMSDAIDELKIEITAESEKADDKIDYLCDKIEKLASSLGSLNGKKPTGLQDLQKATEGVSKVVTDLTNKYKNLGKGFTLKGDVTQIQKEIDKLSNAFERANLKKETLEASDNIHGKMYEYAVRDVQMYKNQLESLKETLESVKSISRNVLSADEEALFARKQNEKNNTETEILRTASVSDTNWSYDTSALEYIANYAKKAEQCTQNLTDKLSQLVVPDVREENLEKLDLQIRNTEIKLDELRTKLSNGISLGHITDNVNDKGFVRLQEQIALTEKKLEALQVKKAEVLNSGTSIAKNIKSGEKATNILSNLVKSMSKCKKTSSKLNGTFSHGIKNLLAYGLGIRSLYVLFNKLRSGIKEGMKNLVQFSTETNASMSLLTNSLTQLKNASAAASSPLLNAFAPALNSIIQICIKATNAVNQLISALAGKSTWIKATETTDNYADSLNKVGESAKGALRPFDELNNITTQSGNGSGTSTNATDMFEIVDIDSNISDFANQIKDAWLNSDFESVGTIITQKFQSVLNSIQWDEVYSTSKNFGNNFASFLNGLITPETFATVGSTIAGALNTALYLKLSFAKEFDFANAGKSVAEGINNFFEDFDFSAFGESVAAWVDGLFDFIVNLVANVDWIEILKSIGKAFKSLDAGQIVEIFGLITLGTLFKTNLLGQLGASLRTVTALTPGLTSGLTSIASKIFVGFTACVAAAFAGWNLGNAIYEYITGDDTSDIDWKSYFVGEDKATAEEWAYAIKEYVTHDIFDSKSLTDETGSKLVQYAEDIEKFERQTGISLDGKNKATISFLFKNTKSLDWCIETLSNMGFEVDSLTDLIIEDSAEIVGSTATVAKSLENDVGRAITYITDDLIDKKFVKSNNNIMSSTLSLVENVSNSYNSALQNVGSTLMSLTNNVGNSSETLKNKTISMFDEAHRSIKNSYLVITNDVGNTVVAANARINNSVATMSANIGSALSSVNTTTNTTLTNITNTANTKSGELSRGTSANLNNMINVVGQNMSSALSVIQKQNWYNPGVNLVGGLINGINAKWGVGGAANTLTSKIVSLASSLTSSLKKAFGIHSPSKLWEEEIGEFLPPGIANGISNSEGKLLDTTALLATDMTDTFNSNFVLSPAQDFKNNLFKTSANINSTITSEGLSISTNISKEISAGLSSYQTEQNMLLREQNNLLLQILNKETISIDDVYAGVVNRNRDNVNRTGLNPLVAY